MLDSGHLLIEGSSLATVTHLRPCHPFLQLRTTTALNYDSLGARPFGPRDYCHKTRFKAELECPVYTNDAPSAITACDFTRYTNTYRKVRRGRVKDSAKVPCAYKPRRPGRREACDWSGPGRGRALIGPRPAATTASKVGLLHVGAFPSA